MATPLFRLQLPCLLLAALAGVWPLQAQSAGPQTSPQSTPPAAQPAPPAGAEPTPGRGQIIIQSHGDAPDGSPSPGTTTATQAIGRPPEDAKVDVADAEREAPLITRYDLDARLQLASAGLSMRARLSLRNAGSAPLKQIPLQISSTLRWESATLVQGASRVPLPLAQHRLDTDADHTGAANEAVLSLPEPLAPGAAVSLDLFYSGQITEDAGRLARLGATRAQGGNADWDGITPAWTGLRGFGNVLWYPVASPQLFLAEGNQLFTAIGRNRLRDEATTVQLALSVEYTGEPPVAAYFCGRRADLKALADHPEAPIAGGQGLARAEFSVQPLGFRMPSLFVIQQPEQLLGGQADTAALKTLPDAESTPVSSSSVGSPTLRTRPVPIEPVTDTAIVALASSDTGVAPALGAAANHTAALLTEWLGPRPLSALTVLDHDGQPYQDGPLLVAPAATLATSPEAPALVYSLTHAWVQTGQPWMDEGLSQFFALLWVEREHGREAALAQMAELLQPVALAEPDVTPQTPADAGQPLVAAPDELFYRRKGAAVWWMLRDLAGEQPLRAALSAWRTQPESTTPAAEQATAFQHLLERLSGKDLGLFFNDWVLHDRGLPDLSIVDVATSRTPAGPGHSTGWLVAVTVRNDGGAVANVPLTVHSGQFSTSQRVQVAGFGQVTERVLIENMPTDVVLNDGSVPELRTAVHTRTLDVRTP